MTMSKRQIKKEDRQTGIYQNNGLERPPFINAICSRFTTMLLSLLMLIISVYTL